MTRSRTLRPSFFSSFSLAEVSRDARLLFAGLWVEADDDGRLIDSPRALAGAIFPHDDDVTVAHITAWIDDLERIGVVRRYSTSHGRYLVVTNFKEHQKPPRPAPSRLPEPPGEKRARRSRSSREKPSGDSLQSTAMQCISNAEAMQPSDGLTATQCLGFKGLGFDVCCSSSSGSRSEPDDDDERSQVDQAIDLLARRDFDRRQAEVGAVGDQARWLRAARIRRRQRHADKLAEADFSLLNTPELLADWLEPPSRSTSKPTPLDTTAAAARVLRERSEATPCSTCGCRGGSGLLEQPGGAIRCPDCNPITANDVRLAGSAPDWPAVALKDALAGFVSSGHKNGAESRQGHNHRTATKPNGTLQRAGPALAAVVNLPARSTLE